MAVARSLPNINPIFTSSPLCKKDDRTILTISDVLQFSKGVGCLEKQF